MLDGGRAGKSRRWCSWCRYLFFILVLAAVLFCSANLQDMAPDWSPKWWTQYNATKWWVQFKSHGEVSHGTSGSVGFTPDKNSSGTTAKEISTTASWMVQLVTHRETAPSTPPAYVSPGPYFVEYPNKYHFVINEPTMCKEQEPFVVLMVPVAPHNRAHRDIIRDTWGSESEVLGKVVKLFFLLGLHTGESGQQLQEQMLQESREHRDLIQSDFRDCYKNLTIKTMVMLEWLDAFCSGASYAMKIDSDTFLNVPKLISMLSSAPKRNYMTGLVAGMAPVLRDPTSKWYVPEAIYPKSQYPRYALGLGYILSLDLPKKLLEASRHVRALYIEDVYLGLCMEYMRIPVSDPPNWGFFQVFPVPYSRCAYANLVATTVNENTDRLWVWKDFKSQPC